MVPKQTGRRGRPVQDRYFNRRFQTPPDFHRPIPMWMWNGDTDEAILATQIKAMHEQGIRAFFIHPMPDNFRKADFCAGLTCEYLSETFFAQVKFAVTRARALGMKVWLYDEGGWPSGHALGKVAERHPEYRGKVLTYTWNPDQEFLFEAPPGSVYGVARNKATGYMIREPLSAGETWLLPNGHWDVVLFLEKIQGYPVDLFNPEVTQRFIALTHERYRQTVGDEFGRTILGIFTDEPRVGGQVGTPAIPWTARMPEHFRALKGYDLWSILPLLFDGIQSNNEYSTRAIHKARYDYYDVYSQVYAQAYFQPIAAWCRHYGLLFTGHLNFDHQLQGHLPAGGQVFRVMIHLDVPGLDVIWRQLYPGQPSEPFPKYVSSVAHLQGKPYVLSESFAVYGWGLTYQIMKWVTDYQFVRGVNLMDPMAFYYSSEGPRLIGTLSNQFLNTPLWDHYHLYSDYVGRLSYLLSQGQPVIRSAVYYPIGSLWAEPNPRVIETTCQLCQYLLDRQCDFDFIDDDTLLGAVVTVAGGEMRVGEMGYQVLLLPYLDVLPLAVLEKLVAFHRSGGTLLMPWGAPGGPVDPDNQQRFQTRLEELASKRWLKEPSPTLDDQLGKVPKTVHLLEANPQIRCCHRRDGDLHIFFLVNEADRAQSIKVVFPVQGRAQQYDPESGQIQSLIPLRKSLLDQDPGPRIALDLPPYGSTFVLIDTAVPGRKPVPRLVLRTVETMPLAGPWQYRRLRTFEYLEGHLTSRPVQDGYREISLESWDRLVGETFSGDVEYRTRFDWSGAGEGSWYLDLGDVRHVMTVWLNDTYIGTRLWLPYAVEVSRHLKTGPNHLRVVVSNSLINQMGQPEVNADLQRRGWFNGYADRVSRFSDETRLSGLLGPVRLCRVS